MKQFALRVDKVTGLLETLGTWLAAVATCYLVVFEQHAGENPHYHVMFDSDKKLSALRKDFQRKFEQYGKGNSFYSLKECDDDIEAYGRYMCKGESKDEEPHVVLRQGILYTDEWVQSHHREYWVNNEALNKNKRKRNQMGNVVEQVEAECKRQGVRWDQRKEIAAVYIRIYRDARKSINPFAASAVVNTVALTLCDDGRAEEELAERIANKL